MICGSFSELRGSDWASGSKSSCRRGVTASVMVSGLGLGSMEESNSSGKARGEEGMVESLGRSGPVASGGMDGPGAVGGAEETVGSGLEFCVGVEVAEGVGSGCGTFVVNPEELSVSGPLLPSASEYELDFINT